MPKPPAPFLVALLLVAGCSRGGGLANADMNTGQTIIDLTDAVSALQQRNAEMQAQIDSLQRAVVRQDSLISRVGAATGVPIPLPVTGSTP